MHAGGSCFLSHNSAPKNNLPNNFATARGIIIRKTINAINNGHPESNANDPLDISAPNTALKTPEMNIKTASWYKELTVFRLSFDLTIVFDRLLMIYIIYCCAAYTPLK
jgi:hypothetical protein